MRETCRKWLHETLDPLLRDGVKIAWRETGDRWGHQCLETVRLEGGAVSHAERSGRAEIAVDAMLAGEEMLAWLTPVDLDHTVEARLDEIGQHHTRHG